MFSGIVEEMATVVAIKRDKGNIDLTMECSFTNELKMLNNNDYQGGLGMYGDYSYGGKSTLDKYKTDKDKNTGAGTGKVVDITGGAGNVPGENTGTTGK